MNYFTLCVQNYADGTESKKSLYTYESETEAVARFHSFLGGYMGGDNLESILATVTDGKGRQLESKYWEAEETTDTTTTDTTAETTEATE